jgi:hypothetical protein
LSFSKISNFSSFSDLGSEFSSPDFHFGAGKIFATNLSINHNFDLFVFLFFSFLLLFVFEKSKFGCHQVST